MYICPSKKYNKKIAGLIAILAFYKELEKSGEIYFVKIVSNYLYYINFNLAKFNFSFIDETDFVELSQKQALFFISKGLDKYNKTLKQNFEFSESCKNSFFEFPIRRPVNSENAKEFNYTNALYYILEIKTRGNQWTMIKESEMNFYKKYGFIELFASPFNSRTNYCSLFESDKVFGSFGDNKKFIKSLFSGKIYYKHLIFSPPSGIEVNTNMVNIILQILSLNKKFHIVYFLKKI